MLAKRICTIELTRKYREFNVKQGDASYEV